MSRPIKDGLDYFPLNTVLDDGFELIEAKYGLAGFAIVIKLYQKIYQEYGYFYPWGNEEQLLFAKRINADINLVNSVVADALEYGIFDKAMYKKQVLTSHGIQIRYIEASKRRKSLTMYKDLLLINVDIIPINVNNNPRQVELLQYKCIHRVNNNPQRMQAIIPKGNRKEKKGNEIKEEKDVRVENPDYVEGSDWEVTSDCPLPIEGSEREGKRQADLGLRTLDAGNARVQNPDNLPDSLRIQENHDKVMTHHDKVMQASKQSSNQYKVDYSKEFLSFYDSYPRQEGKKAAQKTFNARIKQGATLESMLSSLAVYKAQIEQKHTEPQYIKLPSTFLNCFEEYAPKEEPRPTPKMRLVFKPGLICPLCKNPLPEGGDMCPNCNARLNYGIEREDDFYVEVQA